jgi:L-fuculose-phosphate aldolase
MKNDLEALCQACHILYEKGLICSLGGNVSLRIDDTVYITPTGGALGRLQPEDMVRVGFENGITIGDGHPSKELGAHLGMLHSNPDLHAVVHVHPTNLIAYTARYPKLGAFRIVPTNAAFYVRAGQIPLLPYYHSGSAELHQAVSRLAADYPTIALANHGIMVIRKSLLAAVDVIEEIEQNCEIYLLAGENGNYLTEKQIREIDMALGRNWPEPNKYADLSHGL